MDRVGTARRQLQFLTAKVYNLEQTLFGELLPQIVSLGFRNEAFLL